MATSLPIKVMALPEETPVALEVFPREFLGPFRSKSEPPAQPAQPPSEGHPPSQIRLPCPPSPSTFPHAAMVSHSPRHLVEEIEAAPALPPGLDERFNG